MNDVDAYKISLNLSDYVWDIVIEWEWFAKKTVGSQFVNAADSISVNIAEGSSCYGKKIKLISQETYKYVKRTKTKRTSIGSFDKVH